jgi:mannose-6-phosphate isomerase-like protein (cupin superfamily)
MAEYSLIERGQALDYLAQYPGYGEMRSYTGALGAEQIALTWRMMPPGTGGRGSYGHRHRTQEEIYLIIAGTVTFKVGDEVFEAGPGTAVRIPPDELRSVHNDTDAEAELVISSTRVDDIEAETITEDGFWPE